MNDITKTSPIQPITLLGRIGADPSRLITVRDWWHEMDEPVELLFEPEATFRHEEQTMIRLSENNGIAYRPATATSAAGFPVWLFLTISA